MGGVFMSLRRKRRLQLAAAVLAVLTAASCAYLQSAQKSLAGKLIRLHVVANSDSAADQARKLQVRDAVLACAQQALADAEDPRAALAEALPALQQAAQERLRALGDGSPVTVTLCKERFPTRAYETFSLPAGVYESLRVRIGSAQGHNWWCVVFPALCMSAGMDELELAAQAAGMTQGEVRLITGEDAGFELKFRTLELLQKLKALLF